MIDHQWAIYANGHLDARGQPSKVSDEHFEKVCMETDGCSRIDEEKMNITNIGSAFNLPESSIAVGDRLRSFWWRKIHSAEIDVRPSTKVTDYTDGIDEIELECISLGNHTTINAERVVNTIGLESLPANLMEVKTDLGVEVVYQVCVALKLKKKVADVAPMSFIVMDGWFPCLMPSISGV